MEEGDQLSSDSTSRTNSQQLNDAIIESSENPISMNQDNQNQTSKRKRESTGITTKFKKRLKKEKDVHQHNTNNLSQHTDSKYQTSKNIIEDVLVKYAGRSLEELQDKIPREDYIRLAIQRFLQESPYQVNPQNSILKKEILPVHEKGEYENQISMMLYAFGDVSKPNEEVVRLLEIESRRYIKDLFQKFTTIMTNLPNNVDSTSMSIESVSDDEDSEGEPVDQPLVLEWQETSPEQTESFHQKNLKLNPKKKSEKSSSKKLTLDVVAEALFPDIESIRFVEYIALFLRRNKRLKLTSTKMDQEPTKDNEHFQVVEEDESAVSEFIETEVEMEDSIIKKHSPFLNENQNTNFSTNMNLETINDNNQSIIGKNWRQEVLEVDNTETWHPNLEYLLQKYNSNSPDIMKKCKDITIDTIRHQRLQRLLERDEKSKKLNYDEYLFFSHCCRISFARPRQQFKKWLNHLFSNQPLEFTLGTEVQDVIAYLLYRHLEQIVREARNNKLEGVPLNATDIQNCLQKYSAQIK